MEQLTGSCCGEEGEVQIEDHTVEVTLHESHLACEVQEDELVTTGSDAESDAEGIYQDSYGSWEASQSASVSGQIRRRRRLQPERGWEGEEKRDKGKHGNWMS
uniref:Uncharacterized protein n=1 Tax=Sphaerodactylus townsendi TaxID=933632 RepID=A0ACB8EF52_9SAUR